MDAGTTLTLHHMYSVHPAWLCNDLCVHIAAIWQGNAVPDTGFMQSAQLVLGQCICKPTVCLYTQVAEKQLKLPETGSVPRFHVRRLVCDPFRTWHPQHPGNPETR